MKLLTSQKDILFDLIETAGLSPSQFEFEEIPSKMYYGEKATLLKYKNSDFYFRFETGSNNTTSHYAIYCPGESAHTENNHPGSWDIQLGYVEEWLSNLSREINSLNKWDRLKHEIKSIRIKLGNDEDKFSAQEYTDLKKRMTILKQGVKTIGLLPDQINTINDRLDYLTGLAEEMNKFDWKGLFIGTIISIIIQLSVSVENAETLWALIKKVFNNYLLP